MEAASAAACEIASSSAERKTRLKVCAFLLSMKGRVVRPMMWMGWEKVSTRVERRRKLSRRRLFFFHDGRELACSVDF